MARKNCRIFVGVLLSLAFIQLFQWVNVAYAAEIVSRSYDEHPQPEPPEWTPEQRAIWDANRKQGRNEFRYCHDALAILYTFYNERYPNYKEHYADFSKEQDPYVDFIYWKRHLIEIDSIGAYCVALETILPLIDSDFDFESMEYFYCGRDSKDPETGVEWYFFKIVERLTMFSAVGHADPKRRLLGLQDLTRAVQFNPDVEYFLRKSISAVEIVEGMEADHLVSQMTRERLAFVNQAVDSNDFQAVIDTTAPCGAQR